MNKIFTNGLATLALTFTLTTGAMAESPAMSPNGSSSSAGSVVLSANDPDHTGYPFINNWKDGLNRDVTVFLHNDERQALTQARVDESLALQPVFLEYDNAVREVLMPNQLTKFEAIVARQDMAKLAGMSAEDTTSYMAMLSQTLHLTGRQEEQVRGTLNQLMADATPIHATYAANFDTQIAAAVQRVALERESGNWTISTSPIEKK